MISRDPARANKYDLVVVPSWMQNKPWPPPAVKVSKPNPSKYVQQEAAPKESETRLSLRQQMQLTRSGSKSMPNDRVRAKPISLATTVRTTLSMLALSKQFSRSPASPPHAQARGSVIQVNGTPHHRSSILEDKISYGDFSELEFGLNFLTYDQKDAYKCVFHRFEVPGKGLSRAGLVKALAELGHVPTTAEDSKRYARLQRNILKHTRLKAGDHESQELQNTPLDNPDGLWTYEEFLLMCEAMRELEGR